MGLFGKLFGKKRTDEQDSAPATMSAAEAAPAPAPSPAPMSAAEPAAAENPAPMSVPEAAEPVPAHGEAEAAPMPAPVPGRKPYGVMRYDRSFTAKLIQTSEEVKAYHARIEAELLSYGVHRRVSWKYEAYRLHRRLLVKVAIRRKTLCLYFALSPEAYAGSKYKVEGAGKIAALKDTPCLYRILNPRRCKYAADLIADVMAEAGIARKGDALLGELPPYESTERLLARGLIREVGRKRAPNEVVHTRHEVRAAEVDEVLTDDTAAVLVEQSVRIADKTKQGIINIDTIAAYFKSGETVTLDEIKRRIPGYGKVTYIKVLARGTLAEPLTVEADEFSIEAVKMILLTGGKVLRTRR